MCSLTQCILYDNHNNLQLTVEINIYLSCVLDSRMAYSVLTKVKIHSGTQHSPFFRPFNFRPATIITLKQNSHALRTCASPRGWGKSFQMNLCSFLDAAASEISELV